MTEKIKDFVEHELKMLDRGIVATPTEDYVVATTTQKLITEVMNRL